MKKLIRPSIHEVITECTVCRSLGNAYLSNTEIYFNTVIKQHCKKCNGITTYKQK